VPTFTLAVSVRFDSAPGDDVVDMLSSGLRAGDDGPLVWRDTDPAVLRLSIECTAADPDGAMAAGLALADDAVELSRFAGAALEVVAMDDERQVVWRAEP
jgi:hypothetical protein